MANPVSRGGQPLYTSSNQPSCGCPDCPEDCSACPTTLTATLTGCDAAFSPVVLTRTAGFCVWEGSYAVGLGDIQISCGTLPGGGFPGVLTWFFEWNLSTGGGAGQQTNTVGAGPCPPLGVIFTNGLCSLTLS